MTPAGSALRRTMALVLLALGVGAALAWRRGQLATPVPAAAPVWPPLAPADSSSAPGPAPEPGPTWLRANDDGTVPPGHPIKAKDSSGIFHVPGGRFYDRTTPDRCYPTAAAAEADGYRQSKS
jgi:hypothetical protein